MTYVTPPPLARKYIAARPMPASGVQDVVAHGLAPGGVYVAHVTLTCTTAGGGFAVGDTVSVSNWGYSGYGIRIIVDETSVKLSAAVDVLLTNAHVDYLVPPANWSWSAIVERF